MRNAFSSTEWPPLYLSDFSLLPASQCDTPAGPFSASVRDEPVRTASVDMATSDFGALAAYRGDAPETAWLPGDTAVANIGGRSAADITERVTPPRDWSGLDPEIENWNDGLNHTWVTTGTPEILATGTPTPPLASIDWGTQLSSTTVHVYFAPSGAVVDGVVSAGWTDYELAQAMLAMEQLENVTNLKFVTTADPNTAAFKLLTINYTDPNFLALMYPPGGEFAGNAAFNYTGYGWDWDQPGTGALEQGGMGFATLVHELGHGTGLAHPHDDGGTSTIMEGVTSPFDSYGAGGLNQGIFTVESFNRGWPAGPLGPQSITANHGFQGTLMALDIAVLQSKYGANVSYASGDTLYVLPQSNGLGTYYEAIWDAGGVDEIRNDSGLAATIDLRPATLLQETGGGGYLSWASGIRGGFTVANGVVIENATGGSASDTLIGNDADNILNGNKGNDLLRGNSGRDKLGGGSGDDVLKGGAGDDQLSGWVGNDVLVGGLGADILNGGGGVDLADYSNAIEALAVDLNDAAKNAGQAAGDVLSNIENLTGGAGDDTLLGNSERNTFWGGQGDDVARGRMNVDIIYGNAGNDRLFGGQGNDNLVGGLGNDRLYGEKDNDTLVGRGGDDILVGGAGRDQMRGGTGNDTVSYEDATSGIGADLGSYGNNTGEALGDQFLGIENLTGSAFDDALYGNKQTNLLRGSQGNDLLKGRAGDDTLAGGLGQDRLNGGTGDDSLSGGYGIDTFVFAAGNDHVTDFNGDFLSLNRDLWGGTVLTARDILGFAKAVGADTVFDFGGGNSLTLDSYNDIAGLETQILSF